MVEDRFDDLAHVVNGTRADGHDLVETGDEPLWRIVGFDQRRRFGVAGRQIGEKAAHRGEALLVVFDLVVADTGLIAMHLRAAHIVVGHVFAGRRLDQSGPAE